MSKVALEIIQNCKITLNHMKITQSETLDNCLTKSIHPSIHPSFIPNFFCIFIFLLYTKQFFSALKFEFHCRKFKHKLISKGRQGKFCWQSNPIKTSLFHTFLWIPFACSIQFPLERNNNIHPNSSICPTITLACSIFPLACDIPSSSKTNLIKAVWL